MVLPDDGSAHVGDGGVRTAPRGKQPLGRSGRGAAVEGGSRRRRGVPRGYSEGGSRPRPGVPRGYSEGGSRPRPGVPRGYSEGGSTSRAVAVATQAPPRDDRPGTLRVVFRRKFRGETRTLELAATAPEATFSTPLYVPTRTGFARNPGSRESFAASVTATASVEGAIVDERTFEGACLEFGGVE